MSPSWCDFDTVSPLFMFFINQQLVVQNTKPLYPHPKYSFGIGIGIGIWAAKKLGIYPSCVRSSCSPLKHAISEIISPHFDTSEAEGLEREEIPYIGCGSCP